jgi:general secretion pathway protein I
MKSPLTPLQEIPASSKTRNENGFSLLEVIVALAIMAIGYITVFNLFSASVKSVGTSDEYMRAVQLANSKLSEMEMMNYEADNLSGTFKEEKNFQWSLDIEPYDSPLNDPDKNINLSKIILKVFWGENEKRRNVELVTLKLDGSTSPAPDSLLAKVFSGGINAQSQSQAETPAQDAAQSSGSSSGSSSAPTSSGRSSLSGSGTGGISGASSSFNISGS